MGIAHESDNVYWAFNGDAGALDRYDFHEPHVPGGEDHADGEVWRYAEGELERVPEVPSHLVYDAASGKLYVADTGHGRVVVLDTTSGTANGEIVSYDGLATRASMSGAVLAELVPPGTVELPSGVALHGGVLFVSDHATGRIVAFDAESGRPLRNLDTGLGPNAVAAVSYGPDGHVYFSDVAGGRVFRIEP
jgi:DNA-binding beta-propeller fold protein YncE